MFYTLASKFLIKKTGNETDYLYIYVVGSVCYILLHWFLYTKNYASDTLIGKCVSYFYYIVALDMAVAYTLYQMTSINPKRTNNEPNNTNNTNNEENSVPSGRFPPMSPEQKELFLRRMHEARRFQQIQQQMMENQANCRPNVPPETDSSQKQDKHAAKQQAKQKDEQQKDEQKEEKKSIFSKSDEDTDTEPKQCNGNVCQKRQLKNTKESTLDDTEIPVYKK